MIVERPERMIVSHQPELSAGVPGGAIRSNIAEDVFVPEKSSAVNLCLSDPTNRGCFD